MCTLPSRVPSSLILSIPLQSSLALKIIGKLRQLEDYMRSRKDPLAPGGPLDALGHQVCVCRGGRGERDPTLTCVHACMRGGPSGASAPEGHTSPPKHAPPTNARTRSCPQHTSQPIMQPTNQPTNQTARWRPWSRRKPGGGDFCRDVAHHPTDPLTNQPTNQTHPTDQPNGQVADLEAQMAGGADTSREAAQRLEGRLARTEKAVTRAMQALEVRMDMCM
jgi:hypothetical protein